MKTELFILSALLVVFVGCAIPASSTLHADNLRQKGDAVIYDPAGGESKVQHRAASSNDSTQFADLIDAFIQVFGGKPSTEPSGAVQRAEIVQNQDK